MSGNALGYAIIGIAGTAFFIAIVISVRNYLKYIINHKPEDDLQTPLMQPSYLTGTERTVVMFRAADLESGLSGKLIARFEACKF